MIVLELLAIRVCVCDDIVSDEYGLDHGMTLPSVCYCAHYCSLVVIVSGVVRLAEVAVVVFAAVASASAAAAGFAAAVASVLVLIVSVVAPLLPCP